jgi:anti-sigma B factor antagonist
VGDGDSLREEPVLSVDTVGSAVVVRLAGELDLYNADQVRQALGGAVADSSSRVVIDLTQVLFVDSTVLGVLIEAHAASPDGAFRLAAPQLEVRRALLVSGLDRKLHIDDTLELALGATP